MSIPPPAMQGKTVVITGTSAGIGRPTAVELAREGAEVVMCNRSAARSREVMEEIAALPAGAGKGELVEMDLASFASVRGAAEKILARGGAIDVLINNAGVAGIRGATEEGFELAFGTNHLGHFLFTTLLLERLQASKARVVTVASRAHVRAKGIDWEAVRRPTRTFSGWPEYQVSKLANVLFSSELARRTAGTGVRTYALHPGVVASDLWRRVPWPFRWLIKRRMISNEEGARTTLYCATSDETANESGLYYDDCRARPPARLGRDEALARELWQRSEEWVTRR